MTEAGNAQHFVYERMDFTDPIPEITLPVTPCGLTVPNHGFHLHEVRTGPKNFETHFCDGAGTPVAGVSDLAPETKEAESEAKEEPEE